MLIRLYLTAAALLYLWLAIYCTFAPQRASEIVHLERQGPGGYSEFLVIYGGLELAMALLFLLPWTNLLGDRQGLWVFVIIHAVLVIFRTASFFLFGPLPSSTQQLAIGEWVLLIGGLLLLWLA